MTAGLNQIYEDYLFNFEKVEEFYNYDPRLNESFVNRNSYLQNNYQQNRDNITKILKDYNQELDCNQKTLENIELLKKGDAGAVVTGQQAGILTGPLYTIYKAITAILLAKKASRITNTDVVPIFWVASEDHDFEEINHINLINTDNKLDTIKIEGDYIGTSIGDININDKAFDLIDSLVAQTYDTDFKDKIISELYELAKDADDLAEWFSRIILELFNEYGLIIFDPMWPEIRKLSVGIYKDIIKNQESLTEKLQETNQELQQLDYSLQINKDQDNSHLFVYLNGERNSLLINDQKFYTRNQKLVADQSEILKKIEDEPTAFSPNVVLRPIVQNYLLPTVAYVGGPGEISYHSQLKELYSIFDLQMPILYPRESITIIESRLANYMEKYDIRREDIIKQNLDQKLEKELAKRDELNISETFGDIKDSFTEEYKNLINEISKIDQNLNKLGRNNLERIIGQVEYLEDKTEQFHKRNSQTLVRQFNKMENNLLPFNNLQERVFNIFPYLIKYDYDLIDDLVDYFNLDFEHRFFYYRGDDEDDS
ncbi:bacillithiol biosynthesis cysteine-adding enzyme BshC [Selenihalanaerobacter shriftii]|uniref:Putative cysteine ligase BshC n=1 Tax=Selenihalanaerobacter shriftii TaxID=142842 RepID=A0A1T4KIZ2_9FIRM|nr:bacillithiol biosynthesis cysteine-adding enzyme BshC [Selenihalanaerobacter shriftii]SJZ42346.1 bacillithiol biosynthesis cysteine-adding enzyme BshC [Selenihalanaerobacter shriftii]